QPDADHAAVLHAAGPHAGHRAHMVRRAVSDMHAVRTTDAAVRDAAFYAEERRAARDHLRPGGGGGAAVSRPDDIRARGRAVLACVRDMAAGHDEVIFL